MRRSDKQLPSLLFCRHLFVVCIWIQCSLCLDKTFNRVHPFIGNQCLFLKDALIPFEVTRMEGSHTTLLNEEALSRVANDKKTLFILQWLSHLDKTLPTLPKVYKQYDVLVQCRITPPLSDSTGTNQGMPKEVG